MPTVISLEALSEFGPLLGNIALTDNLETEHYTYKRVAFPEGSRAIYVEVPKNACTSIKHALAGAFQVPSVTLKQWREGFLPYIDLVDPSYSNNFKFSFVRNPWDRVVSAWEDKFNREPQDENHQQLIDAAKKQLGVEQITFEAFVHLVTMIPDNISNIHWRSQHLFLCDEDRNLLVDFVGKFEELAKDLKQVAKELDTEFKLEHHVRSNRKAGYKEYYTDQTRAMIAKRYAADISLFSYSF